MSQKGSKAVSSLSKKQVRKHIFEKITGALAEYKQELGDKKLATHVKKASKLITRDLERINKKNRPDKKKIKLKKASANKIKAVKPEPAPVSN